MHPGYRRDIDGLRALAVTLVVLFHAFPDGVPGGFIGVDIFLVISGFLISSIIMRDLEQGVFTFRNFYSRRIRRIFPALLVLLATNLIAGWFVLLSDEYRRLGRHVFGGAAFLSNFFLLAEIGYFDTAADAKPLLHLWSLAIEEQFYLLYPLFLWVLFRKHIPQKPMLVAVALASFATGVVLLSLKSTPAAYYSPMSRLWELLLGGLLAFPKVRQRELSEHISNISALVGVGLIMASAFMLGRGSAFPGWNAIPPVLGAGLLLHSLPRAIIANLVFESRVAVIIGLISYPLYLWHWSLLSFARILGYTSIEIRLGLLLVSVVLAVLTYWYIERPVRARSSKVMTTQTLILGMAAVGCAGLLIQHYNGVPSRPVNRLIGSNLGQVENSPNSSNLFPCPTDFKPEFGLNFCSMSRPEVPVVVLIGDSHAQDKFSGIASADSGNTWLLLAHNSCPPVLGAEVKADQSHCEETARDAIAYINRQGQVKTVVMAFFGAYMLDDPFAADHKNTGIGPQKTSISSKEWPNATKVELLERGLDRAIRSFEQAGKQVVLVIDGPELPFFPRDCARQGWESDSCKLTRQATITRQRTLRAIIASLQKEHPEMRVFDAVDFFCPGDLCEIRKDEEIIFRDSHHLSTFGSRYFGEAFIRWLRRG